MDKPNIYDEDQVDVDNLHDQLEGFRSAGSFWDDVAPEDPDFKRMQERQELERRQKQFWNDDTNLALGRLQQDDYAKVSDKRRDENLAYWAFSILFDVVYFRNRHKFLRLDREKEYIKLDCMELMFDSISKLDMSKNPMSYMWVTVKHELIKASKKQYKADSMFIEFDENMGYHKNYEDFMYEDLNTGPVMRTSNFGAQEGDDENVWMRKPEPYYPQFAIEQQIIDKAIDLIKAGKCRHKEDLNIFLSEEFDLTPHAIGKILTNIKEYAKEEKPVYGESTKEWGDCNTNSRTVIRKKADCMDELKNIKEKLELKEKTKFLGADIFID